MITATFHNAWMCNSETGRAPDKELQQKVLIADLESNKEKHTYFGLSVSKCKQF